MRAVAPDGGGLTDPEVRPYSEVKKGYTSFLTGDVIMAKITPCMENGKTAVVPDLPHELCFGSTEFHVIRPEAGVQAQWIANFLLQHETRRTAQRHMTGAVGQMRVPTSFLENLEIPVAPASEQQRITDALDELLSDLDAGVEALRRAQVKLALYRASVLKAAVQGDLTAGRRKQHPDAEPASVLLKRILAERRQRWEQEQLQKFAASGKTPPANWRSKYKEPAAPDTTNLPELPEGWSWASLDQLCIQITDGEHIQPRYQPIGKPMLSAKNVRDGFVSFDDIDLIAPTDFENCIKRCAPTENDVLIVSVGATTGRTAIVGRCEPFSLVRSVLLLRPIINSQFIFRWIQSPKCQELIRVASGSTAQAHLYINDTKNLPAPLPPSEEITLIIDEVDDQFSVIEHLQSDIESKFNSCNSLRQSILRRAFTGRLVPQDSNDEPASELLKRVAEERAARAAKEKNPSKPAARRKKREK
jgi:type I restriction enzyme S subunit